MPLLLSTLCRRFRRDERGSISVEGIVMLVPLLLLFLASFVYVHAFRLSSLNEKASYVVADMLSRQTDPVNSAYLNGLQQVYAFLIRGQGESPRMRLSVITYDGEDDDYNIVWTRSTGTGAGILTEAMLDQVEDRMPVMPDGETVLLVETFVTYVPPINAGIGTQEFSTFVVTRPRYAPQIVLASN